MSFTFVDLFSGIGGFHAALSGLGGRAVLAAEIDPLAAEVYAANWGIRPKGDVTLLAQSASRDVPPHDALLAGFPCQPFSKSGRQLGMGEARGRLINDVLEILQQRQPKVVLLENVRNIAGPRQRHVWEAIVTGLREAGYRVSSRPDVYSPHRLPPHLGGGPQVRERVYIFGVHVGQRRAHQEEPPPPPKGEFHTWSPEHWRLDQVLEVEHKLENRNALLLRPDELRWLEVWNDLLGRLPGDVPLPSFPMWSDEWVPGHAVQEGAPHWKQRYQAANLAFYACNRVVIDSWRRKWPELRGFPASRRKLEWQAQSFTRDLRLCLLHFRPSGIRAKRPTYSPALVAMQQTPVYGPRLRRISPKEAARLQGFPEWFRFGSQPPAATYKQLGNAVHVGTAAHVFSAHVFSNAAELITSDSGLRIVEAVGRRSVNKVDVSNHTTQLLLPAPESVCS